MCIEGHHEETSLPIYSIALEVKHYTQSQPRNSPLVKSIICSMLIASLMKAHDFVKAQEKINCYVLPRK